MTKIEMIEINEMAITYHSEIQMNQRERRGYKAMREMTMIDAFLHFNSILNLERANNTKLPRGYFFKLESKS